MTAEPIDYDSPEYALENVLQIYGQGAWHDPAFIVGDKTALSRLRDAIGRALEEGEAATGVTATDGEGYIAVVLCREDRDISGLRSQYGSEEARYNGEGESPYSLLTADRLAEIEKQAAAEAWPRQETPT